MAMKLVSYQCPACGADLIIEENRDQAFCSYCGSKILLQDENIHTYHYVDEASIKQTEAETMLRMKELESKEESKQYKRKIRSYFLAGILIAVGLLLSIAGFAPASVAVIAGIIIATTVSDKEKAEKREKEKENEKQKQSPDAICITESMCECEGENYNSTIILFESAGFENVRAIPLNDLNTITRVRHGKVKEVSIAGKSDFEEGDTFSKKAKVLITYHSLN